MARPNESQHFCLESRSNNMTVQDHYEKHLAHFYSWMVGDFKTKSNEFKSFLKEQHIKPSGSGIALDLGAGHGIQSIALAELGFHVTAIDFNKSLLDELKMQAIGLPITALQSDIKKVKEYAQQAEIIVCCGDTLSHLDSKAEIKTFIEDCSLSLAKRGTIILSFRDYATPLTGVNRFIPVKSDDSRILTCVLEYEDEVVRVSDVLHERIAGVWQQKVSTYTKVRITAPEIVRYIEGANLHIHFHEVVNRLVTIVARKKG